MSDDEGATWDDSPLNRETRRSVAISGLLDGTENDAVSGGNMTWGGVLTVADIYEWWKGQVEREAAGGERISAYPCCSRTCLIARGVMADEFTHTKYIMTDKRVYGYPPLGTGAVVTFGVDASVRELGNLFDRRNHITDAVGCVSFIEEFMMWRGIRWTNA